MKKKQALLYIDDKTVRKLITMKDAISIAREAFAEKGRGRVDMPAKIYLAFKTFSGDLRIMPSYFIQKNICGVKIVNSHPQNPIKFKLPTVMAKVLLVKPETGEIYCIMNATHLTALRTGAAGALAASYLARKNAQNIGFIGSGAQALTQLQGILEVLKNVRRIYVYGKDAQSAKNFYKNAQKTNKKVTACANAEDVCRHADVLITTTPSTTPVVRLKWLQKGVHINAIGADAPFKQELESAILQNAKVVVDDMEQCLNAGEINVPYRKKQITEKNIYTELSQLVLEKKKGRSSNNELTVFDSTGVSILDVLAGFYVYEKAVRTKKRYFLDCY